MFGRVSDLQLERDPSGRFLPWAVALMVFLATLALAAGMALHQAAQGFARGGGGHLTVQIAEDPSSAMASRVAKAVETLKSTPGIADALPQDRRTVERLLEPWLGRDAMVRDLPLPALIDVAVQPGVTIDIDAVSAKLQAAVPGARLDDPRPWLERLAKVASLLEAIALAIVAAIGGATVAMVVFATRAGLDAHREVIEVLHLIGARDRYIARQFQWHALILALKGSLPGLALAVGALIAIVQAAARLDSALLPDIRFDWMSWAALALSPPVALVLAAVTARWTVLAALRRML